MSDALPPLTALRAFEAAARHMSFARAAEELHVTPAALSFQIKSLESHLGQPLFHRLNRAVDLTELGRVLSPGLEDGFSAIRAAWRAARRLQNDTTLTITAGPAFTTKWLSPRLYDFSRANPDVDLRIVASLRMLDFTRDEIDVAVRFGMGQDEGLVSLPFLTEFLTPMMSPTLAKSFGTLDTLQDAPILHDDSIDFLRPKVDWAAWCNAAGLQLDVIHGPRFSQADHALDAAIVGSGVVLGRSSLAATALKSGALVAPFRVAITTDARFRLVHQKGAENRPQIRAFISWIQAEAQAVDALCAAHELVPVPLVS